MRPSLASLLLHRTTIGSGACMDTGVFHPIGNDKLTNPQDLLAVQAAPQGDAVRGAIRGGFARFTASMTTGSEWTG